MAVSEAADDSGKTKPGGSRRNPVRLSVRSGERSERAWGNGGRESDAVLTARTTESVSGGAGSEGWN